MGDDLSKISKHWGKQEPIRNAPNFYNSPLLRSIIIENAYGCEYVQNYKDNSFFAEDIFINKYLINKNIKSILSLCCGFGSIERRFISKLKNVDKCTGIDLSENALKIARNTAKKENLTNISYIRTDLNNYIWKKNEYDLIIANGALHHLSNLENIFEGISNSLKPGGMLYACEYVGPSLQDHSIRQMELINSCSYLLPIELRARRPIPLNLKNESIFNLLQSIYITANRAYIPEEWPNWKKRVAKIIKSNLKDKVDKLNFGAVYRSPKKYYQKIDPSECIRSSDIIPLSKKYLPGIEIRPIGGGILQHALDVNFYSNFDVNKRQHVESLELLNNIEKYFINSQEIGIENAFLIWEK